MALSLFLKFQFHKGTIKTEFQPKSYKSNNLFQFHKGTIKTQLTQDSAMLDKLFQFHKGTIKTACLL